jgi:(p)ppGpp synthase/HD superfamily hydrolase
MEILLAHSYNPNFDVDFAVQLALFYDTLEDTDTTYGKLARQFGKQIADGVLALIKNDSLGTKQEKMADSLRRINQLEKEVGMVKLADRITNLQKPSKHWSPKKKKSI